MEGWHCDTCEVECGGKNLPPILKVGGKSADFGGNLPPYHREFQALLKENILTLLNAYVVLLYN